MPRRGPERLRVTTSRFPAWWAEWTWEPGAGGAVAKVRWRLWAVVELDRAGHVAFFRARASYEPGAAADAVSPDPSECEPWAEGEVDVGDEHMRWTWPARMVSETHEDVEDIARALGLVRAIALDLAASA